MIAVAPPNPEGGLIDLNDARLAGGVSELESCPFHGSYGWMRALTQNRW